MKQTELQWTLGVRILVQKMDDLLMKKEFEFVSVIYNRNNGNIIVKVKKQMLYDKRMTMKSLLEQNS